MWWDGGTVDAGATSGFLFTVDVSQQRKVQEPYQILPM
jgi:hypothetical protein